jgi:hypothetical protein
MSFYMPRYYFHLMRNGKTLFDHEGTELSDVAEAQREAFLTARDLLIRILKTDEPVPLEDGVRVVQDPGVEVHAVTLKEALG